jgi:hypothetical protein
MKNVVLAILLIICCFSAKAQYAPPIDWPDSATKYTEKVGAAYHIYNKNRLSMSDMLYYLQVFPKTKDDFIFTFDPDDKKQLYPVYEEHIDALEQIGMIIPDSVLKIGLGICKKMNWSYGVSEKFQHAILAVAANNPVKFVDQAYMLRRKELDAAIRYLADVEAKPDCAVLNKLIDNLHEVGAYNLEGMLQRARVYTH